MVVGFERQGSDKTDDDRIEDYDSYSGLNMALIAETEDVVASSDRDSVLKNHRQCKCKW